MTLRPVLAGWAILGAIAACARIDIPIGVTIRIPNQDATLHAGESFRVLADSDIDWPESQDTLFEVRLAHPASGYAMAWEVRIPSGGGSAILDEFFVTPADAPPSEAYELRVSAHPAGEPADQTAYAFTDRIRVRVDPAR